MDTLTTDQQNAYDAFVQFIHSFTKHMFLLHGRAGTGKTYLTQLLVDYILSKRGGEGMDICMLAPTHKALRVLKSHVDNPSLTYMTIAAFLCKKQSFSGTGQQSFVRSGQAFLNIAKKFKYIFVDEASMIEREDFECFERLRGHKIIWIGDSSQLPPVSESSSIVFERVADTAALTTCVRTGHETLQNVYDTFHTFVHDKDATPSIPKVVTTEPTVFSSSDASIFADWIRKHFEHDNTCRILAYRNVTVDAYNKFVRSVLYSDEFETKFLPGEQLVFTAACVSVKDVEYANNTEVTVEKVDTCIRTHPWNHVGYEVYRIQLEDGDMLYSVTDKDLSKYTQDFNVRANNLKSRKARSQAWAAFYKDKYMFDPPVVYNYAMTVYKSQGSTISTVFIDLHDIYYTVKQHSHKVMRNAVYTGVSRASQRLFLKCL
jgi:AAA domain/UvrD-like helicase C-terminal domain